MLLSNMNSATRRTAAFDEMHRTMKTARGAVTDGTGRELFGG